MASSADSSSTRPPLAPVPRPATNELKRRYEELLAELKLEPGVRVSLSWMFEEALRSDPALSVPTHATGESTQPALQASDSAFTAHPPIEASDDVDPPPPAAHFPPLSLPGRYWYRGFIGAGSMGEVHRVYDRALRRPLAMKVLRPDLPSPDLAVFRFIEEAQVTAQLEHPGIVPVHDIGLLPDGRWFFTAMEARGRRLTSVVREVHEVRLQAGTFADTPGGWSFRRLVSAFRTVCEAVGYSHARGVVHRDLKPDNILVGEFGEVLVLDWGLARPMRAGPDRKLRAEPVRSDRQEEEAFATRAGIVAGTPAFMPPEQARGEVDRLGPWSDVYALGGVLYEVIFGSHPYEGMSAREVLERVKRGPPPFPPAPWAPMPMLQACRRALRFNPEDRFPDAGALGAEIHAWLEGALQRERAQEAVQQVRGRIPNLARRYLEALRVRERSRRAVSRLAPSTALSEKERSWEAEERAERELESVEDAFQDVVQQLQAALLQCPDLLEGRAALADLYRNRHDAAAAFGQTERARQFERLLREYDIGTHAAFLAGLGRMSLTSDPPASRIVVERFEIRGRRLTPQPVQVMDQIPAQDFQLPAGSYLLGMEASGRIPVRYPVHLPREGTWTAAPPGQTEPRPVWLPPENLIPDAAVYVPEGWAIFGGDAEAPGSPPRRRLWMYGFAIARFPVTHQEYLAFLDALAASEHVDEAVDRVPRMTGPAEADQAALYRIGPDARFRPVATTPFGAIRPGAPVTLVRWSDAAAYCLWLRARTALPWRLVSEAEREKAARGVDGRCFPWGDHTDPSFSCSRDSMLDRPGPPALDAFPVDVSPYGVHGLAGGSSDWCVDMFQADGPAHQGAMVTPPGPLVPEDTQASDQVTIRAVRGGSFDAPDRVGRAAARAGFPGTMRRPGLGFRLALTLDELRSARG
jgi:eukaryotic-like serine/threonine-protein kinase